MTNYPKTVDWHDNWKLLTESVDTLEAKTINPQQFVIQAAGDLFNSYGLMYTKKQVKTDGTQFWWGYTTQVNLGQNLKNGQVLKQFLTLKELDVKFPVSNYLNFYCQFTKGTTTNPLEGTSVLDEDCGQNEVSVFFNQNTGKPDDAKGDNKDYSANKLNCPNRD